MKLLVIGAVLVLTLSAMAHGRQLPLKQGKQVVVGVIGHVDGKEEVVPFAKAESVNWDKKKRAALEAGSVNWDKKKRAAPKLDSVNWDKRKRAAPELAKHKDG